MLSSNGRVYFFMVYPRHTLSLTEQIEWLRSRGLDVPDAERAMRYLSHIGIYRFCTYTRGIHNPLSGRFLTGTTFDQVLRRYIFDRQLRLLLLEALERVEVAVRAHWAYQLSQKYGSEAYLEADLFAKEDFYRQDLEKLKRDMDQSSDGVFKGHWPPVWVVCEAMSFGSLSRWYGNLRSNALKKAVARDLRLDAPVLESAMHHLTVVRNLCAHHARIWDRNFSITLTVPRGQMGRVLAARLLTGRAQQKIYNTFILLDVLMNIVNPRSTWSSRILLLLEAHPELMMYMGFPEDWKNLEPWSMLTATRAMAAFTVDIDDVAQLLAPPYVPPTEPEDSTGLA